MRTALIIILLFSITLPCFAQLTKQDVELILQKALEPINKEIIAIKLDIAEMKGKMATKDDIIAMRQNLTERMDTLYDRMGTLYGVIIGVLVAIIVAILTLIFTPFLKGWLERRKDVKDEERLQRIETELAELKAIREVAKRLVEEKPEFAEAYRMVGLL